MPKIATPKDGEPITLVFTAGREPRYRVRLDVGVNPRTGKRRQARSTHDSLREARAAVAKQRADRERGVLVTPDRESFESYALRWHSMRARQVREVTAYCYRCALSRAFGQFGTKPVGKVTRADIEILVASLHDAGRSRRTASLILFVLRSVFDKALDENLIGRNPATRVEAVGRKATVRQALSVDDMGKLTAHLIDDDLFGCWLLTLYGLRRSEVLGVRWSAVDFKAATLAVRGGRVLVDGKRTVETDPKTDKGARTLTMPANLAAALRTMHVAQRAAFGFEHARTGLLAVNAIGEPVRPEHWSHLWRTHCAAAGVPAVTLHEARHSSVTAMRARGIPDQYVAAWHGHDETVMRRTYTHPDAGGIASAGTALAEVLAGHV
jgi:integrase